MRNIHFILASLFTMSIAGCSTSSEPAGATESWEAAVRACDLEGDTTITREVDIHACSPGDTKKTTICHIPPGNPANAHTICVGNAAVQAHVGNHQDTLGPCAVEPPCGSDDDDVDAGTGGGSDDGGGSGDGSGDGSDDGGVVL